MERDAIDTTVDVLSDQDLDTLMLEAEHLNGDHGDTVLFVARYAGGHADAREAEIVGVDRSGVDFALRMSDGNRTTSRVPFGEHCESIDDVRAQMQAFVGRARAVAGEAVPATSIEREIANAANLPTFQAEVVAVRNLALRIREITFGGGLDDFRPIAPDQFLLVSLPEGSGSEEEGLAMAYYTVRRARPEVGEVDIWFVLHDDHGPLSGWASTARQGDRVSLWGPRSTYGPPEGTEALLLVADDTGLPAVAAILESPDRPPAHAVVEVYDRHHTADLALGPDDSVDWLFRGDRLAGTGTDLLDAVTALDLVTGGLYAFGAGESRQVTSVRKYLRHTRGMTIDQVQMTGYWRRRS